MAALWNEEMIKIHRGFAVLFVLNCRLAKPQNYGYQW